MSHGGYKIATFYKFTELGGEEELLILRDRIRSKMSDLKILGTFIIATEGFNATLCGRTESIDAFIKFVSENFDAAFEAKITYSNTAPFRKIDVKVKPEIVTLKKPVEMSLGTGTHVPPSEWNRLLDDPEIVVLDTRNEYEFRTGTFERAINPGTEKFSDLPGYIEKNLNLKKQNKIAMFCTGGIRCEKFAPYLKALGFENVYQLEGGILKYLEEIPEEEQRWIGECYVFDTRVTVNERLEPSGSADLSQEQ